MLRTIALACAAPACITVYPQARSAESSERIVAITAKRFTYSPATITVKKNQPVVFELTSEDVMMGFNLPDFHVRSDIAPGRITRLRLVPDRAGEFVFLCDIFCGSGHEDMNGKLVVVD